jgi:hypothetical protein
MEIRKRIQLEAQRKNDRVPSWMLFALQKKTFGSEKQVF